MREALRGLEDRYVLAECAVADYAGQVKFDLDDFGRYGVIGFENKIDVECRKAPDFIADIILHHGQIDILKIDIEGLEERVIRSQPAEQRRCIRKIYAELEVLDNPIPDTHTMHNHGPVRQFLLR